MRLLVEAASPWSVLQWLTVSDVDDEETDIMGL